jgi:hypothetical protein
MKNIVLSISFFAFFITLASAQVMEVKYSFLNIVEGYDHDTRMVVYVDGNKTMTSNTRKESQGDHFDVVLPEGQHGIRLVNEAFYEGTWQEHTISNEYSQNLLHEFRAELTKKSKIKLKLVFDLDKGNIVKLKIKKGKIL